jgi:hypothetical protein
VQSRAQSTCFRWPGGDRNETQIGLVRMETGGGGGGSGKAGELS